MSIESFMLYGFISIALASISGCGSSTEIPSFWNNNEVVVDGNGAEWKSNTFYLNDQHVTIGARNDQNFLYICLMSSESQFRRQMVGAGLTIWFEADGGMGKWGIHYPIGFAGQGKPPQDDNQEREGSQEDRDQMMQAALQQLEILGPGKDDRQQFSTLQQMPGIEAKIGNGTNSVVYELKVPLHKSKDYQYWIGPENLSTVKVSMETGNFERGKRQSMSSSGEGGEGGEGGGGYGGGGGRRGGGGGMGGGRGGGGRKQGSAPSQFKFNANIRLAASSDK